MALIFQSPFDIQCLIIEYLTYWDDLKKTMLLYAAEDVNKQKKALNSVKRILNRTTVDFNTTNEMTLSEVEFISLGDLSKFINIEIVEHPVVFNIWGLRYFSSLKYLTTLTIEFNEDQITNVCEPDNVRGYLIKLLNSFFESDFRKEKGHLICYTNKNPKFDLIPITNFEDSNFIYDELHRFLEIDVTTGKYIGFISQEWSNFFRKLVPKFIIQRLDIITLEQNISRGEPYDDVFSCSEFAITRTADSLSESRLFKCRSENDRYSSTIN